MNNADYVKRREELYSRSLLRSLFRFSQEREREREIERDVRASRLRAVFHVYAVSPPRYILMNIVEGREYVCTYIYARAFWIGCCYELRRAIRGLREVSFYGRLRVYRTLQ